MTTKKPLFTKGFSQGDKVTRLYKKDLNVTKTRFATRWEAPMTCPGCGNPITIRGAFCTWYDPKARRLLKVFAICPECMRRLEESAPEERTAFVDAWEIPLFGGRPK
jgi:hypothetical protein